MFNGITLKYNNLILMVKISFVSVTGTWYRFESGERILKMSEHCMPIGDCGSPSPVWLDDEHPYGKAISTFKFDSTTNLICLAMA